MRYPVERGSPSDWYLVRSMRCCSHHNLANRDEYSKLWEHALRSELNVNPEEVALVLTDAPHNVEDAAEQNKTRRRLAQIAFEQMGKQIVLDTPRVNCVSRGMCVDNRDATCAVAILDRTDERLCGGGPVHNLCTTLL